MQFIQRLLVKDVFGTVRRIYKQKKKSIPSLCVSDDHGVVSRVSNAGEKAEIFLQNFLENSKVGVKEDVNYVARAAVECTGFLTKFSCEGSQVKRNAPRPDVMSENMVKTISVLSRETLTKPFDPCTSYFSIDEIQQMRQN
jgi:hypothetical protein